jgi:hypothetical protein
MLQHGDRGVEAMFVDRDEQRITARPVSRWYDSDKAFASNVYLCCVQTRPGPARAESESSQYKTRTSFAALLRIHTRASFAPVVTPQSMSGSWDHWIENNSATGTSVNMQALKGVIVLFQFLPLSICLLLLNPC